MTAGLPWALMDNASTFTKCTLHDCACVRVCWKDAFAKVYKASTVNRDPIDAII